VTMRKQHWLLVILALWVGGMVFPLEWLGLIWPGFGTVLGRVFATDAAHTAGHALLFAGLGLGLLVVRPAWRHHPARYLAVIALIALAQESAQLWFKARPPLLDDFTDGLTDLTAAYCALRVACYVLRDQRGEQGAI
jgi:hypothetical protein